MTGVERRAQILSIAAEEFAVGGLHGTSTETIARRADITQTYVFRLFGTKKNLFIQVIEAAFEQLTEEAMQAAAEPWAHGVRTRIEPGLFTHITSEANR